MTWIQKNFLDTWFQLIHHCYLTNNRDSCLSSFTSFVFAEWILQYTSTPGILIPAWGAEDPKSNKINILNHLIIKDTIIIADNKQIHGDIDTGTSYPIHIHYHFWNNPGWNTVWAWRSCLFTTTVCFFYSSRSNTALIRNFAGYRTK